MTATSAFREPTAYAILDIDLVAIADNWRALRAAHGGRPTAAVLKADAYGHGAARVAPYLFAAGCRYFFTAHLDEALAIRQLLPGAMLAVLNAALPGTEPEYLAQGIDPVLGSLAEIDRWCALAHRLGRTLPALLHVDTGMARLGLEAADIGALRGDPGRLAGLDVRYVMTHLVAAEMPSDPVNAAQRLRFEAACAALPAAARSIANSAGLFLGPAFASDLARPGAALFGINPTPGRPNPMRPTLRLRGRILQIRHVDAGEGVGYNATWRAARPSRIAVVGVGYADGFPRALSNRATAGFDGTAVPLVGRVSMDLTTYDVTDVPDVRAGDWLELIGPHGGVESLAAAAGASPYEILTSLGRRYTRIWHA
jgi:alanine racemase